MPSRKRDSSIQEHTILGQEEEDQRQNEGSVVDFEDILQNKTLESPDSSNSKVKKGILNLNDSLPPMK